MQKITPFLWFDTQAEEAAQFYTTIFKNSHIESVSRYPEGSPMPAGTAMSVTFYLEGQKFMALNGGPMFKFTEAISLYVDCKDQSEVDALWTKLLEGGEESQCGWLKDKFGLSWQIIPQQLGEYMSKDESGRVMQAMLKMQKIDVATLEQAFKGN